MLGDSAVERPWLYDKSYEFWLNLGTARTGHPDFTCLNCINEELQLINVIVPRKLIIATQDSGAHSCSISSSGYSLGGQVGLAFIRHIQGDGDYSFLVPIVYTPSDPTNLMDELTKEIIRDPNSVNSLFDTIKRSEPHRQALKTLIMGKKSADCLVAVRTRLTRARHWRRVAPSESDYESAAPVFWYTYEDGEFILDFGLPYRMQLRTLLRRPSLDEVIRAPFSIVILLGYYIYRAVSLSIKKAKNRANNRS